MTRSAVTRCLDRVYRQWMDEWGSHSEEIVNDQLLLKVSQYLLRLHRGPAVQAVVISLPEL